MELKKYRKYEAQFCAVDDFIFHWKSDNIKKGATFLKIFEHHLYFECGIEIAFVCDIPVL